MAAGRGQISRLPAALLAGRRPRERGEPGESINWRFALVQLNDGSSKKGFACLEDLVDYLRDRLNQAGILTKNQGVSPAAGSKLSRLEISLRKEENESKRS